MTAAVDRESGALRILYHHRTQAEDAQGVHISEIVRAFRELGHDVKMASLVAGKKSESAGESRGLWKWLGGLRSDRLYLLLTLAYNLYGFLRLRETAFRDPESYFRRYAELTEPEAVARAESIWAEINGPNLERNILPTRGRASLVLRKGADHSVTGVRLRKV